MHQLQVTLQMSLSNNLIIVSFKASFLCFFVYLSLFIINHGQFEEKICLMLDRYADGVLVNSGGCDIKPNTADLEKHRELCPFSVRVADSLIHLGEMYTKVWCVAWRACA